DLEEVDGQPVQVAERAVAGAEIVDAERDAALAQAGQALDGDGGVLHQDALGDLEPQRARVEAGGVQRLLDLLDQIGLEHLAAGEIDGERERRKLRVRLLEPPHLRAGLVQYPAAEGSDDPGLLGERDEFGWRDVAALLAVPAREGLESDDLARRERHDRLVLHAQLPALAREAQAVPQ